MKFKAGDKIRVYSGVTDKEYITIVKYDRDSDIEDIDGRIWFLNYHLHYVETYTYKEDDICIFWNNNNKSFRVAEFKQVAHGKNKKGLYKDKQGNYFENCEPYILKTLDELINKGLKWKEFN